MTQFVNPFTGVGQADESLGGDWINDAGIGLVEIDECRLIQSKKPETLGVFKFVTSFFLWEWQTAGTKLLPGTKRSFTISFNKPSAKGNMKGITREFLRIPENVFSTLPPHEIDQLSQAIVDASQPVKGTILKLVTNPIPTRSNGIYTKHIFSQPTPEEAARVQAVKAQQAPAF